MVDEAVALPKKSRLDEWYVHYAKAISYWRDGDRQRTVAEAKVVVEMAPFDTLSHIDLAEVMADVGAKDEAIELATFAVTHDSTPRKWYFEILLNAYRSAGKTRELLELAEAEVHNNPQHPKWWYDVLGYAYSATGQEERAREAYKKFHSLPDPPEQ